MDCHYMQILKPGVDFQHSKAVHKMDNQKHDQSQEADKACRDMKLG